MASPVVGSPAGTTEQTTFTYADLENLWQANGGSTTLAPIMAAIALAESGGHSTSLNNTPSTGDYSVGLWQINYYGNLRPGRTARYGSPEALAADPNLQAKAAIDLAGNGSGLGNWSTYTSGAYRRFLGGGAAGGGGGTTGSTTVPVGGGSIDITANDGGGYQLTDFLPGLPSWIPHEHIPGVGDIPFLPGITPPPLPPSITSHLPKGLTPGDVQKAIPTPGNLKLAALDAAKMALGGALIYLGVKGLLGEAPAVGQRLQRTVAPNRSATPRYRSATTRKGGKRRDAPGTTPENRTNARRKIIRANPAPPFPDESEAA